MIIFVLKFCCTVTGITKIVESQWFNAVSGKQVRLPALHDSVVKSKTDFAIHTPMQSLL